MNRKIIKPLLRWAGGKQKIIKHLISYLPDNLGGRNYFEPFLGAGSLFLNISPKEAFLSDYNQYLINCYKMVANHQEEVYKILIKLLKNNSEEFYYKIRQDFNKNIEDFSVKQAARFIFLNKTCFNGIFRVNSKGLFNVPYGNKKNINIPTEVEFSEISNKFRKIKLHAFSYEKITPLVKKEDFVYIDPPYPPLNGTSYFTHYTKDRFSLDDQHKVSKFAYELKSKGCKVLITNADTKIIRSLYPGSDWNLFSKDVTRFISCKGKRYQVKELVITNY